MLFWLKFTALCLLLCIVCVAGGANTKPGSKQDQVFMGVFMMALPCACIGFYMMLFTLSWSHP